VSGGTLDHAPNGRDKRGTVQHARMSELQRRRILGAAREILEDLGYRGITVTQIAGRARVSRKTFYEHFEDREGCLIAGLEDLGGGALSTADPPGKRDPLEGLGGRVTYRTLRVLAAIAELSESHPPSNREVAEAAGIADQGQIARLLGRLEGLGVVERVGPRPARGEANAWRLTAWGEEVRGAVEGRELGWTGGS
jgi:AcrR family transcriptional regulator